MYRVEHEHFWFVGTRDILLEVLRRALGSDDALARARIVDVGCGTGYTETRLPAPFDGGARLAVDLSPIALTLARLQKNPPALLQADAGKLPILDASLDVALSLDVLEHLDDDVAGARELARVVRPGGLVVVTVPAFRALWSAHDVALHHRRRYRRTEIVDVLERAGLAVEHATYFNTLLFPVVAAMRLAGRVRERIAGPSANGAESDAKLPPRLLNRVLHRVLAAERHVVGRVPMPVGVSILVVARPRGGAATSRASAEGSRS
ncbi:MAG: class I SAM-dependent methyltransferase [Deltaproteobacteria bacterium]|nr:class I SAM-dependent methyltransferase [Deltaproteobacteria bacterium]